MKNGLKKVVSILLICMMMMGLSTTSFASDVPGDLVIPREPAAPVTSVTYAGYTWFEKGQNVPIPAKFLEKTFCQKSTVSKHMIAKWSCKFHRILPRTKK